MLKEEFNENNNFSENDVIKLLQKKNLISPKRKMKTAEDNIFYKIMLVMRASSLKPLAINVFYKFTKIYPPFFEPLRNAIIKSGLEIDPQLYIGSLFMISTFTSTILMGILMGLYAAREFNIIILVSGIMLSLIFPIIIIVTAGYVYPFYLVNKREKSIKNNIPFMLNHLYAISYASLSIERAFRMLIEMGEYGELNKEIEKILKRIDVFGDDAIKAIRYVASNTPSEDLKSVLFGILSIIESGGNLREYLAEKSQYALFTYSLERKKYLEALSTYADIYTAILIAAPLFLVAILAVINVIPESKILGMEPITLMKVGTYVLIPIVNLIFLGFLTLTQPEI